jgi:alkaline phosphatase D
VPVPEWVPLKPFVLAALRWVSVAMGLTKDYAGDMLGDEQWAWLEQELSESQAAVHLIVSTVQVTIIIPISQVPPTHLQ